MKPIYDICSGEAIYSPNGNDFTCEAVHGQVCEHCVACIHGMIYDAKKSGYKMTNRDYADFVRTAWYDPVNGRRIGKKAIKKLVAQIRANL